MVHFPELCISISSNFFKNIFRNLIGIRCNVGFRDLETILAQEIHLGYLKKVNEDGFTLSVIENSKTYRGTIALKVSKRKPKPTQKILDMEAEKVPGNKVKSENIEDAPDLENNENKLPEPKTEDQLKDDLIKEKLISNKLFKMKNKIKATKSKMRKEKQVNDYDFLILSSNIDTQV